MPRDRDGEEGAAQHTGALTRRKATGAKRHQSKQGGCAGDAEDRPNAMPRRDAHPIQLQAADDIIQLVDDL